MENNWYCIVYTLEIMNVGLTRDVTKEDNHYIVLNWFTYSTHMNTSYQITEIITKFLIIHIYWKNYSKYIIYKYAYITTNVPYYHC